MKKSTYAFWRHSFRLSIALIFVIAAAAEMLAAPGDLDPTFGTGKIRTLVGGGTDLGYAVARQSDGKLIVAGTSENQLWNNFSLVRYNTNGTLDTTFGSGGKILLSSINGGARAIAVFTESGATKIVAAGYTIISSQPLNSAFMIAKFNADGSPDTTFDSNGIVFTDFGSGNDYANAVAVQTDGRIIAAGFSGENAALVRYNTNGSLDTTFDADGKATTVGFSWISSIGLQSSKIVAVGYNGANAALARFNSNGSLDASFDGDGLVNLDGESGTTASSLAFLSTNADDNRIIVAGKNDFYNKVFLWSRDAANGAPDTTIGTNGRLTFNNNDDGSTASVRVRTSSGVADRILIAGSFGVMRLFLNGAVDTAFGSGGVADTALISNEAMLIQPSDNRIVVAGFTGSSGGDFATARLNANGTLDTTFSGDGKRAEDIGNRSLAFAAQSTLVQPDGKIVVAGDFAVARFNSDGTFDTTFDTDGKAQIYSPDPPNSNYITDAAMQADGKIVAVAYATSAGLDQPDEFLVYRFSADGSPDTSFSGDGAASVTIGNGSGARAHTVGIQSDGGIIVAGFAYVGSGGNFSADFAVARFLPTGALDTTFGTNGKAITPIGTGDDVINELAIQTDNRIVVVGTARVGSTGDFAVARYNPDGSLDTSFSFDGKLITPVGLNDDTANALTLHSGKIVVAGSAYMGGNYDFAVVRYNSDGMLDTTFDTDGKTTTPIGAGADTGNGLAVQADGKILVAGTSDNGTDTDFAVVRYNPDGSLDASLFASDFGSTVSPNNPLYGSGGKVTININGSDAANAIAIDSSNRAVIAGISNGLFGIVRLLGNADPTAATVSVGGRVTTQSGKGIRNISVTLTDASGTARSTITGAFGAYRFDDVPVGENYILSVSGKRFAFENPTQIVSVNEQLDDLNFVGKEHW